MGSTTKKSSEKWIGLIVLAVGIIILLRNLDLPLPAFLFSWPMILIVVGFIVAVKEEFKGVNWLILMALGGFFLALKVVPDWNLRNFIAPAILIAIGLSFLFRRSKISLQEEVRNDIAAETSSVTVDNYSSSDVQEEDIIDAAVVFGALKKNVYSKNFKGGESVAIFGGSEINLTHADFTGTIKLEVVNVFGGTTLFVPAHWQIRSEVIAIFGALEDKRQRPAGISTDKILVIEGFVMFGGIDIKSI
jgi:predicted membrane protein